MSENAVPSVGETECSDCGCSFTGREMLEHLAARPAWCTPGGLEDAELHALQAATHGSVPVECDGEWERLLGPVELRLVRGDSRETRREPSSTRRSNRGRA